MKKTLLFAALLLCCSTVKAQAPNPPTSTAAVVISGGYGGMGYGDSPYGMFPIAFNFPCSLFALGPLCGFGTTSEAQISPHFQITWNAPSPVGGSGTVQQYNVYIGTHTGGPYIKGGNANVTGPWAAWGFLLRGTWYFVVTTVDTNNAESAFSNEASVVAS